MKKYLLFSFVLMLVVLGLTFISSNAFANVSNLNGQWSTPTWGGCHPTTEPQACGSTIGTQEGTQTCIYSSGGLNNCNSGFVSEQSTNPIFTCPINYHIQNNGNWSQICHRDQNNNNDIPEHTSPISVSCPTGYTQSGSEENTECKIPAHFEGIPDTQIISQPCTLTTPDNRSCPVEGSTATISATKIVCDNESDLPNWGTGGYTIDANTATNYVTNSEGKCHFQSGWNFQWGDQNAPDGGATTVGPVSGYTTFGSTDTNGVVATQIPLTGITEIHLREILQDGYIPFTGQNTTEKVSAEFYCTGDALNYDNWDFIRNPQANANYYCVGFNVLREIPPEPKQCDVVSDTTNIVENGTNAVETWNHSVWFDETTLGNAVKWIWETFKVVNPTADETKVFVKKFSLDSIPTSANIVVAADNGFILEVNGNVVDSKITNEHNYEAITTPYDVKNLLTIGENTIRITVKNFAQPGGIAESNPAGALYKLHIVGSSCSDVTITDVCINRDGIQTTVPEGYTSNSDKQCTLISDDYTVSPSAGINGTISPSTPQTVTSGATTTFTVTPATGYSASVAGTCGGALVENTYTTNAITGDCTVIASFSLIPIMCQWNPNILASDTGCTAPICQYNSQLLVSDPLCVAPTMCQWNPEILASNELCVRPPKVCPTGTALGNDGECLTINHEKISGSIPKKPGRVLGAETSCGIYVDKFIKKGLKGNDKSAVSKIQQFLNDYLKSGLKVDGVFGDKTETALKNFQTKHADKILTPWKLSSPTGIFYLTTQTEVNNIMCPDLKLPIPASLIPFSKNPLTPKM